MSLDRLKELIRQENVFLTDFFNDITQLREMIIKREVLETVNQKIQNIEKSVFEFNRLDQERFEILEEFCSENNIKNNIQDVVDYFSIKDKEMALLFADMVDKLQSLSLQLSSLAEILEFQKFYTGMLTKLFNIDKLGKTTYNKTGFSNQDSKNLDWRR